MRKFFNRIREESAGAMVENVIILPLVFVVIYSLIMTAFLIHDRATVEAAAKRGAIYAANCVSNPNYATMLGQTGELDIAYDKDPSMLSFSSVGKKVDPYRAFTGGDSVAANVEAQVRKIVDKTRIPWLPQDAVQPHCTQKNMVLYQDITITVEATYSIPVIYSLFGLETDYKYTTTAKIRTTDPDEFIRNADLVVDLVTDIDNATGGNLQKITGKISELATKVIDWLGDDGKSGDK